jgi:hypothetical protein
MADPKKVKVFDGTGWVDLKADDPNLPISSTDGNVTLKGDSNKFTVNTNKKDQLTVDSQGRIQFQSTSGGNVLSDADFSTYLQFNGGAGGEAYKDKNIMLRAGASYLVVNSDATVRLINNAVLKGAADNSAEVAFPSDGSFTVSTGGGTAFSLDANKYGRFTNHVGIASPAYSTAALALQSTINSANANGVFGIYQKNNFTCAADAAHANHAKVFSNIQAPADGNPFTTFMQFSGDCACGADVEQNFGLFVRAQGAKNNIGVCVSDGNKVADGDWAFYDSTGYPSQFKGQIQTNTITSKDATTNDASIGFSSAQITYRSDYYHNFKAANPARGINCLRLFDTGNDGDAIFIVTNYGSNYESGTIFSVGQLGTVISSTKGHIAINAQGDDKEIRLGCGVDSTASQELTIAPGDIRAAAGYVPQTDQSLVTKGWVTANGVVDAKLPIESVDGTVWWGCLDGASSVFTVSTGGNFMQ